MQEVYIYATANIDKMQIKALYPDSDENEKTVAIYLYQSITIICII